MRRRLWRTLLWWRFRLFQQHRFARLVVERVAGYPFLVLPMVFNPKLFRTSEVFVRVLDGRLVPQGSRVLDMGTGSGVAAVVASQWAGSVVAVDANPEAVRCARINVMLNRVEDRVDVREGDLFSALGDERFDVVLFHPPYLRGHPGGHLDRAFFAGDVITRFAPELPEHLAPGGHALVLMSSDGDEAAFERAFAASGLSGEVVARHDLGNEVVTVHRFGSR
jgi:HemK-related putative methylase